MALSTQQAVSDGTLSYLLLSIDYLDREDISVYFGPTLAPAGSWSWVGTSDKQISFTVPRPAGEVITVKRATRTQSLYHKFTGGAQFTAKTLDEALRQTLLVAQEFSESSAVAGDDLPLPVGPLAQAGFSNRFARADHVHVGGQGGAGSVGSVWSAVFSGTGAQTEFTLSNTPTNKQSVEIHVDGVYQQKATFSLVGAKITFSEAPPAGTDNIEVVVTTVGSADSADITYTPDANLSLAESGGTVRGAIAWLVARVRQTFDFVQSGVGAVSRSGQDKLRERVSVEDFGAKGDGVTDDTTAIRAAFASCAATGRVPVFGYGRYIITGTVDAKGLPLMGQDRQYSVLLCNVGHGVRTFSNVGQVVHKLHFLGPGTAIKPDGFSVDGYKRYITDCYFKFMGDCICTTAIIVTSVVSRCEFLSCESAINDKLQDGTNAHTTLWFTDNNVLYGSKAFDLRTEVAGFVVVRNVFEDLFVVYEGGGKQLFGSTFADNWVEQMSRSVTLLSNVFAGGTNRYDNNSLRGGSFAVLDAKKWIPAQYAGTGEGSGAGGVAVDSGGVRVALPSGSGVLLDATGLRNSAAEANYANAADFLLETQGSNATNAYRGGDVVFKPGAGSYGQRAGAIRPYSTNTAQLGDAAYRWATAYTNNIVLMPGSAVTPANNGEVTFELTSNTVLKIRVRGSDGVVRSGVITLT